MPGEKARWELDKHAACCFEQNLEAAFYKTTAVWPLTSYLINYPNKVYKTCWVLLEKERQTCRLCFPMDSYIYAHLFFLTIKSLISHHCTDTGCHLKDLSKVILHRDGWRERESRLLFWTSPESSTSQKKQLYSHLPPIL